MIHEMDGAWIAGRPVALAAAIAEAARLLSASRLPVIAGLDCDVLGAREAIALARRLGGVCDQDAFGTGRSTRDAMHETGALVTTPNEARLRADTWLMVGSVLAADWPDIVERVMPPSRPEGGATERRMVWLCPDDRQRTGDTARQHGRVVGGGTSELPALLAALRARVAGRPVNASLSSPRRPASTAAESAGKTGGVRGFPLARERLGALDELAADLKAAKFGVALWSPRDLDPLATEMLFGLIDDLNAQTRFAAVPVPHNERGPGVMQACGWLTGFPPPVSFGRGVPEHDPWRFDAARLIESGEADCTMWISVVGQSAPWERPVPDVVIGFHRGPQDVAQVHRARVYIKAGCPGIDHDGLLHSLDIGTIAPAPAVRPSDVPSVADILARIAAALSERPPC